jgi:hypothetical protein
VIAASAPPFPASAKPVVYSWHVKLLVTAAIVNKQITLWELRRKNFCRGKCRAERPMITVIQKVLYSAVFNKHEIRLQTSALPQF